MRHFVRNSLLTFAFTHPAALSVLLKRGPRVASAYLKQIYQCSKIEAGLHLPIVEIDELTERDTDIKFHYPSDHHGSLTITECASLCALVAARQPKKILEIGSFQGLTTLNMAMNAPQAEIHTLDLPDDFDPANTAYSNNDAEIIAARGFCYYADREEARMIRRHYGDTARFDFVSEIGPEVDFCLVDAAHSYDYVRSDTLNALNVMQQSGLLLWHDYGRNDFLESAQHAWGVSRFLHEIARFGVGIIKGTSFGVLQLTPQRHDALSRYLTTG